MRNAAAAVQAYRRAVDLDPRDYRAWYGLGQTYELLQMPLYALHYFRKAAALRPFDSRMWCAMAECYVALERRMDAIRCFERAVENVDREGIALSRLARYVAGGAARRAHARRRLYHELGDTATAAKYYEMHVQAVDEQRVRVSRGSVRRLLTGAARRSTWTCRRP
jgi:tetratricopeptide (TPR) repeat protein